MRPRLLRPMHSGSSHESRAKVPQLWQGFRQQRHDAHSHVGLGTILSIHILPPTTNSHSNRRHDLLSNPEDSFLLYNNQLPFLANHGSINQRQAPRPLDNFQSSPISATSIYHGEVFRRFHLRPFRERNVLVARIAKGSGFLSRMSGACVACVRVLLDKGSLPRPQFFGFAGPLSPMGLAGAKSSLDEEAYGRLEPLRRRVGTSKAGEQ